MFDVSWRRREEGDRCSVGVLFAEWKSALNDAHGEDDDGGDDVLVDGEGIVVVAWLVGVVEVVVEELPLTPTLRCCCSAGEEETCC